MAETLADAGARVEILQATTTPLWAVSLYSRMTALERLERFGVRHRLRIVPLSSDQGRLTCRSMAGEEMLGPYDAIVHAAPGIAATALQGALEAAGLPVRAIGDALAPRTLFEAMQEAQAAARGITA